MVNFFFGDMLKIILVTMRLLGFFMVLPGFGTTPIPARYKMVCILGISCAIVGVVPLSLTAVNNEYLVFFLIQELILGLFLGMGPRLIFQALECCGQLISLQMNLSNATMFNPQAGGQISLPSHCLDLIGIVIFFQTPVLSLVLKGLLASYDFFPILTPLLPLSGDLSHIFVANVGHFFSMGVQLALPFIFVGLMSQLGLGFLNKIVPAIQVFFISVPLQTLIGVLLFSLTIGTIFSLFFQDLSKHMFFFEGM